jgi:phenylacetate-CoA ligase
MADVNEQTDYDSVGDAGGVTANQLSSMFNESMYWPSSRMHDYQLTQLESLVRHAKRHVPFYAKRLDCLFKPDGSIDWSRWRDIPILSREEVRDSEAEMMSRVVPPLHGAVQTVFTSGSTGIPLKLSFPRIFTHVAGVAWQRFYKLHGVKSGQGLIDFKVALPTSEAFDAEYVSLTQEKDSRNLFMIRRNLPTEITLGLMQKSGFKTVIDSPNNTEVLAQANLRCGKPVQLDFIIGIGMGITPKQQVLFMESFGAKSVSPYSSKEGSLMAFECPYGQRHFHSSAELLLLEVLNDQGEEVAPGESGISVITPFFNSAQPLIRYRQGDILIRGSSHCTGGITLPSITGIVGRQDAIFKLSGGDVTMFGMNNEELSSAMKADAFQFAQIGPDNIEVRYVSQYEMSHADCERVANEFQNVARSKVKMTFRRMEHIPLNAGGKQQRFVNECKS